MGWKGYGASGKLIVGSLLVLQIHVLHVDCIGDE